MKYIAILILTTITLFGQQKPDSLNNITHKQSFTVSYGFYKPNTIGIGFRHNVFGVNVNTAINDDWRQHEKIGTSSLYATRTINAAGNLEIHIDLDKQFSLYGQAGIIFRKYRYSEYSYSESYIEDMDETKTKFNYGLGCDIAMQPLLFGIGYSYFSGVYIRIGLFRFY